MTVMTVFIGHLFLLATVRQIQVVELYLLSYHTFVEKESLIIENLWAQHLHNKALGVTTQG